MADVTITYKGETIAEMSESGSRTLETGGTYCEDDIGIAYVRPGGGEEYAGPYEATPTQGTQIFATAGKSMLRDFTVNPIPSNYGLITWNGAILTVS